MSQNAKKKQSARERMQEERARQQKSDSRRRKIVIGSSILAVVIIGGGIAAAVETGSGSSGSTASSQLVVPANATGTDGTVIVYGKQNAPNTLDLWEDFRCPFCDKLEKTDGPAIQQLADQGTYKIQYHMATFLDNNLGGKGSKTALSVAGAALNEGVGQFKKFHDVLYANQPDEQTDGFSSVSHLLDLAGQVPGLKTPAFVKAAQDGTYDTWAAKVSDAFNSSGVTGTPTVKLNGKDLNVLDSQGNPITPAQYTALIQQSLAAKK